MWAVSIAGWSKAMHCGCLLSLRNANLTINLLARASNEVILVQYQGIVNRGSLDSRVVKGTALRLVATSQKCQLDYKLSW